MCPPCSEEEENRILTTVAAHSEQASGRLHVPDSSVLKGLHGLTQASVPLCKSRRSTKESVSRPPWINVQTLEVTSSYCQDRMLCGSLLPGDRIGIRQDEVLHGHLGVLLLLGPAPQPV